MAARSRGSRMSGRVELGAQTYSQSSRLNGKPAAGIAIYQLPTANALNVATRVNARMAELAKTFPQDLTYVVPFDTTRFVNASINEVYKTLLEAAVLVLIVILVFLQDWRATLVPATTVPVTIIGAFAAMAALGFTVNLSTLFAIILAIGIVVDDAIVVVEGAAHHIERGLTPHDAAIKAMDELFGPIIGITLVLMSVFIPAAFLPGLTGQMYAQFALVIAATALISAINAATLKPTQCALWLRMPVPPEKRNFFFRGFNRGYQPVENGYARLIGAMARHSGAMVIVALVVAGLGVWGIARLPTSFIPIEDQGYVLVATQLPDGAAVGRTQQVMDQVTKIALGVPGVDQVIAISGISVLDNSATLANAGRRLRDPEGLERAQAGQRRRSAFGVRQSAGCAGQAGGRRGAGADTAADPGHRQCQRLHHAGRVARRQLRLRQAADHHSDHRAGRQHADRAAAAQFDVPRRCATDARGRGSGEGGDAERRGRRCVQCARRLCRIELRQPVQQVRPHVPGLCAGGFEVSTSARRHREPLCAQPGQQDGAAGHPGDDTADGRAFAGRPLQPVSDGEHRGRSGRGVQLRRGDEPDGADRRQDLAARRGLRVDRDVLSGEARRQPDHLCVRPGHAAGLSVPGRPVRKLDRADIGDRLRCRCR